MTWEGDKHIIAENIRARRWGTRKANDETSHCEIVFDKVLLHLYIFNLRIKKEKKKRV